MFTSKAKPTVNPEVVVTELNNDEAVLLHLDTKLYYSLNTTGLWIWKRIGEGQTLGDISHRLQDEFEVTPEKAHESVLSLATQLRKEKLIDVIDAYPGTRITED